MTASTLTAPAAVAPASPPPSPSGPAKGTGAAATSAAPSAVTPGPTGRAERLEQTVDRLAVVLFLVTPVLTWWLLRGRVPWGTPALVATALGVSLVVALVPIFVAAYVVERRRALRRLEADLAELYPVQ